MSRTKILRVEGTKIIGEHTNYQGFVYDATTNICTPTNQRMWKKWAAVKDVFSDLVCGRTFLDVGPLYGFFCLKALECGATKATGVEKSKGFYEPMARVLKELPIPRLEWVHAEWPTEHQADVIMMMSVMHYLFPALSLREILRHLRWATHMAALVEFVGPGDASVVKNLGWAPDHPEYTRANFEVEAQELFGHVEYIGQGHTPDRWVYLLEVQ